ncbi:16610_t:CDS:2 [Funneliformis geosporum]|nr:16610_t:CDS:2 [Funneliformis geosporum]
MTSSEVAKGRTLLVEELINEDYKPEWTGGPNDRGIDIKVEVDGTNFVIHSKHWRNMIYPAIVREMDGVLVRQPPGTVGVIVAPDMNRYSSGTKKTARTSPFQIILTTRTNLIRDLRVFL